MDRNKSQDDPEVFILPDLNPEPTPNLLTDQLGDALDERYDDYDDYPYDMPLNFEEHPNIVEDLGDGGALGEKFKREE